MRICYEQRNKIPHKINIISTSRSICFNSSALEQRYKKIQGQCKTIPEIHHFHQQQKHSSVQLLVETDIWNSFYMYLYFALINTVIAIYCHFVCEFILFHYLIFSWLEHVQLVYVKTMCTLHMITVKCLELF